MNISWIVTPHYHTTLNIKDTGPIWGSDITWKIFNTDNVVCFDFRRAADLINRNFQRQCNFYIPESFFINLNRPSSVNLVGGGFANDVDQKEEIVAAHLIKDKNDIILMGGFDFSSDFENLEQYERHRANNFLNSMYHIIESSEHVQWVILDHSKLFDQRFSKLKNLTKDTTENVISLLS